MHTACVLHRWIFCTHSRSFIVHTLLRADCREVCTHIEWFLAGYNTSASGNKSALSCLTALYCAHTLGFSLVGTMHIFSGIHADYVHTLEVFVWRLLCTRFR